MYVYIQNKIHAKFRIPHTLKEDILTHRLAVFMVKMAFVNVPGCVGAHQSWSFYQDSQ